jgi:hypothetical protein
MFSLCGLGRLNFDRANRLISQRGCRGFHMRKYCTLCSRDVYDAVRPILPLLALLAGTPPAAVAADRHVVVITIDWPCTRGSKSIADNFPDVPNSLDYTTPRLKDELNAAGLLGRFEMGSGPVPDEIWTEAACRILRGRKPALLARPGRDRIVRARVQVVPEGGIGMVYLTDPATADRDREAVRRLFHDAEGIAGIVEPEDFPKLWLLLIAVVCP